MVKEFPNGIVELTKGKKDNGNPLLVVVHPWFRRDHPLSAPYAIADVPNPFPISPRTDSYLKNMDTLLSIHEGPTLFLDDVTHAETTIKDIEKFPKNSDRYLALTKEGHAIPLLCQIGELMRFVQSFRRELLLAGGYLPKNFSDESDFPSGCLGNFYSWARQDKLSLRFVDGCCYGSKSV